MTDSRSGRSMRESAKVIGWLEQRRKSSFVGEGRGGKVSDDTEGVPKLSLEDDEELEMIDTVRVGRT